MTRHTDELTHIELLSTAKHLKPQVWEVWRVEEGRKVVTRVTTSTWRAPGTVR